MEQTDIIARLRAANIKHDLIAEALGRSRTVAVQIMHGRRPLKVHEIAPLTALLDSVDTDQGARNEAFVPIEVFPTYAGAGGGSTGEGGWDVTLVPRHIVEGTLRGRPSDFLMVEVRGTSMEPKFRQGDQVLVDRRERDPRVVGGGPFFLRIGDAYLLKNVEIMRDGLRVFSTNTEFSDEVFASDELELIGRPVWLGRMI